LASPIKPATAGLALLSIVLGGHLILRPFRQGWSQMLTDFPNHYVAAVVTVRHQPLRRFYDWEWFQRQIQYTGIERQLGGYAPYTPLTMLPFLPLAELKPQRAKQVWLVAELFFLAAAVWLLSRLTGLGVLRTLVLALLAHAALSTNFLAGQYYIFLMLLLACAAWCLLKGHDAAGGALLGLIFSLKLYAAPFLFFFAVRRQWKAFWGMAGMVALLTLTAVAMFGWNDVWYFATNMLPRGINGEVTDPYNAGLGSATVLFRRFFVPEAELNPHPLLDAPAAFFFFRALYVLGILVFSLLALPKRNDNARSFAWFVIVLFALSPVTASSHFILLLVPVAVLLLGESASWQAGLIALYILVELPMRPWSSWMFPKLWFLLALALYVGWRFLVRVRIGPALAAGGLVVAVSAGVAYFQWSSYQREPQIANRHAVVDPGALFSSAAALSEARMIYESIGHDRFVLRASEPAGLRTFEFEGPAFHPSSPLAGEPVYFELLTGGHSRISAYRDSTKTLESVAGADLDAIEPVVSPDGTKLAFVSKGGSLVLLDQGVRSVLAGGDVAGEVSGPAFFRDGRHIVFAEGPSGHRAIRSVASSGNERRTLFEGGDCFEPAVAPDGSSLAFSCTGDGGSQVWLLDLKTGMRRRITQGACNNTYPAWDPDSRAVVFASDCNRGVELPALFRATLR
jgi:Tol biopolymer transport system component